MANHIAVTPAWALDSRIAIAACRARQTGILDLGYGADPQVIRAEVELLARKAGPDTQWGVRWDTLGTHERGIEALAACLPHRVPLLVLAGLGPNDLLFAGQQPKEQAALKKRIKRLGRKIIIEVVDLATAQAAEAAGCDGVILRGHECGGWASRHSSFILAQEVRGKLRVPYWVQGGMGLHSVPAVVLAGASGAVLCEQLFLADESPFVDTPDSKAWAQLDGTETALIGPETRLFRVFGRTGRERVQALEQAVIRDEAWQEGLRAHLQAKDDPLLPIGEDIALAGPLARRHVTVGRILAALAEAVERAPLAASAQRALAPDSPLAQAHRTRFAVVQGPMTRVSDVAPFAKAVADGGGLPVIALSVMRQPQVRSLLTQTSKLLGEQSWGVGILGFMPKELRQEQLDVVRELKPAFAIIAGGRPAQARELEAIGIGTYLHVPSPGLLQGFIKDGARKFIFEGGECGGHTGPLTSFILWEQAIETLLAADIGDPEAVQVLFAGGIHDDWSAAMVATLAVPLVARGMKVGVVMGTAYLFTREIVASGAVLQEFQDQAIVCRETTLLQSGRGMYTRCAVTPFCDEFNKTRRELLLALEAPEKVLKVLELLNIGRLRIASKGISRNSKRNAADSDRYVPVSTDDQRREGMYMLGEVARLRKKTLTIEALHWTVCGHSAELLAEAAQAATRSPRLRRVAADSDIAIIGMACLLPGALDLRSYWQNILRRVNAIREVDDERWRPADFFDARRGAADKVYSKWGGFLDDIQFDPAKFGIPPAALRSIEPVQLLALEVVHRALADAGLDRRPFPRERTATFFASGGMNELGCDYIFRALLSHYLPKVPNLPPEVSRQVMEALHGQALVPWTEDSFPGILANVTAGRVANRFDLGGTNFTVDAACASSLAALDVGVRQLRSRDADVAIVGAVDGTNNAVGYMCFAQTHALSPRGRCRPFDDSADGIALGEGVAALVLKRLADAERDGDRIYALVKGVGSSSDGRNRSLTAPHPQGQLAALRRAYADADVDPATVELIEAHGTGTAVGDKSEIESLALAFGATAMQPQACAVGSVKSMIGHTKTTAGLASLVKTAMALQHRVLPPTIGVEVPNARIDFARSPFFINTETRPWLDSGRGHPRRAGVSAFGFGGTNFHVVLEEYGGAYRKSDPLDACPRDAEPFSFWGHERTALQKEVEELLAALAHPEQVDLTEIAMALHRQHRAARTDNGSRNCRLAFVATSSADLRHKLALAKQVLAGSDTELRHPQGLYYREGPAAGQGLCFLFPGQGSQRVGMLGDLVSTRPALHALFERANALLADKLPQPLARYIYPPPVFGNEERAAQQSALNVTRIAQPALGVADIAGLHLLRGYGLAPDFVAGHSYGEYVALHAAGVIGFDDLVRLSELRGRLAHEAGLRKPGAMAAINADEARVAALIAKHRLDVTLANLNAADQTIVAGPLAAIEATAAALAGESLRVTGLPVSAAFHSPAMEHAREGLAAELAKVPFAPPQVPVFSNTSAGAYPQAADEMRALLVEHITAPVRFVQQIEQLYEAGARIFVEVGPGLVLTGLVDRILAERPHATLGIEAPGRAGWLQLAHVLTELFALGVPVDFGHWFEGRGYAPASLAEIFARARLKASPGPLIWRVNGGRAQPWHGPAGLRPQDAAPQAVSPPSPPSRPAASPAIAQVAPEPPGRAVPRSPASPFPSAERITMNQKHIPPAGMPPASKVSPSLSHLAQTQQMLGQFIALQREQQETLRRFLDFQTHFIGVEALPQPAIGGETSAAAMVSNSPAIAPPPAPLFAPPIPVLPPQVRAAPPASPPPGGGSQAASEPARPPMPPAAATPIVVPTPALGSPAPAPAAGGKGLAPTAAFRADLLRVVAARTGYPEDMLDMDAHMEADLGIDSIKRIEILSQLKDRYDLMEGRDEEAVFEELTALKTLNDIVVWYDQLLERPLTAAGAEAPKKAWAPLSALPAETAESDRIDQPEAVRCYTLEAVAAAPATAGTARPASPLPVLLAGPDSALAEAFKAELARTGHTVFQVIPGTHTRALGDRRFELDAHSLASAQALHDLVTGEGAAVGTLISLLGAGAAAPAGDIQPAPAQVLFLLCKVFEKDLKAAAAVGGGWLLNVTAFDGRFGLARQRALPFECAGTLGVAKSAAREWGEAVRVSCIDVAPELPTAAVVGRVLGEWGAAEALLEVGHTLDGRWQLTLAPQPVAAAEGLPPLGAGAVILITGGAGGITAGIAQALAAQDRPRLVLVGRSPLPGDEAPDTRDIANPAQLKQVLIGKLRDSGGGRLKPADIDRALRRLLKEREIRATLAALAAAGAEVEYHAVDVRDAEVFGALIDGIYERWGRLDGVIHAAGVIDDKLIRDKSLESFSAVYDTKVIGAQVLSQRLRPETLRFALFFSSIAGRFGNAGQADYSAANEVLNKLAESLSQRWPHVHALAIGWGPWQSGMVGETMLRFYAERGIHPIPPAIGTRHCLAQIRRGRGAAEVVIAASLEQIAEQLAPRKRREPAARPPAEAVAMSVPTV